MGEKRKVLIADDEFRIGMLVKALIQWETLNLECVDIVNNGEDAYRVICEKHVDIVITDIRMPRMTGLDLVAKVKETNKAFPFIVISGYKDFEYAHKALQYDVTAYLLKPIDGDELNSALAKICSELEVKAHEKDQEEIYLRTIQDKERLVRKNLLSDLIDGKDSVIHGLAEESEFNLEHMVARVLDIKLDCRQIEKTEKKQNHITMEKVVFIVTDGLGPVVRDAILCEKPNMHLYCLLVYPPELSKQAKNKVSMILGDIQKYLLGFERYRVTIGIGVEAGSMEGILTSIQSVQHAIKSRIKLGTGRLIYAENLRDLPPDAVKNYLRGSKENFEASLDIYAPEKMQNCLNHMFEDLAEGKTVDWSCGYDIADKCARWFFDWVEDHGEECEDLFESLSEKINHCCTTNELQKALTDDLLAYLGGFREIQEVKSKKPIRQAKQYVQKHCGEKIVLEDIADLVGLNPVYFSVLFKKEEGINFSAYLVNVRMDAAKELLVSSNETIAAIAEKVGYKDIRYFSRLFTKMIGIKPVIYRKLYS
ncbi:Regulator of RpoS [bioreactor metagenome]|uniref:Regulator of RpoS n=1 Tax=bioreactor metagenome TaxID=1076179 RepID=A0A644VP49_9ZZZZ